MTPSTQASASERVERSSFPRWRRWFPGRRVKAIVNDAIREETKGLETLKARIRARVEHPFRVVKRQFGYVKVRFRGLAKNTTQVLTLLALSNLWQARHRLLTMTREVRPVTVG